MMHGHRRGPTLRTLVAVLWATACVLAAVLPWPVAAEGLTPLAAAGPSSAVRPEGYQEEFVQPAGQLANSGAKVLIIRESYGDRPWNNWPESSNVLVLQSFGFTEGTYGAQNTGDKYLIAGMDNSSNFFDIDFSKFQVVIVENDNSQAFFDALASRWNDITQWVADGGVLVFHGAEVSWHGGRYGNSDGAVRNSIRPPGMTLDQSAHNVWNYPSGVLYQNYVDNIANPDYASIVAGMASPTWGNYTSHDVFYNVTESATYNDGPGYVDRLEVLTVDSLNTLRATSFVYRYVNDVDPNKVGCVYFGGLTLEWGYYYNYDYGRKMLPQLLRWALNCSAPPPPPDQGQPITGALAVLPDYISPNDDFMDRGIAGINWDFYNVTEADVGLAIVDSYNNVVKALIGTPGEGPLNYQTGFGNYTPVKLTKDQVRTSSWFGRDESGAIVPEGTYTAVLMLRDNSGNYTYVAKGVAVDRTAPQIQISLSPPGQPQANEAPPTVYYSVDIYVTLEERLQQQRWGAGINFPDPSDPNFARLAPRILVRQNNMPESQAVEVTDPEILEKDEDGRYAVLKFTYRVVKATPEDERAGRGWDGPATVIAFAADRSFAPNDGSVEVAGLFEVNTQGPRVAITGVSPGSNAKDDPFRPEFKNGQFTRSRISVRYTANDPNLEGTVYLKIYPGQFHSITREQFDANNPYPIRVLDPISTGALEESGDGFSREVTFQWDGRDALGNFVRAGTYTLVAAADTVVPAAEENEAAQVRPSVDTDDERIFVAFPPMSIGDLHAFPNPVRSGRPVTFVLDLNRPSEVIVELYSTAGHRINTVSFNGNIGRQEYVWSAVTDADGNPLVNGLYLVKVTVFDEAGAPTFRIGKLVVVR